MPNDPVPTPDLTDSFAQDDARDPHTTRFAHANPDARDPANARFAQDGNRDLHNSRFVVGVVLVRSTRISAINIISGWQGRWARMSAGVPNSSGRAIGSNAPSCYAIGDIGWLDQAQQHRRRGASRGGAA